MKVSFEIGFQKEAAGLAHHTLPTLVGHLSPKGVSTPLEQLRCQRAKGPQNDLTSTDLGAGGQAAAPKRRACL
jgi:hypothetical protein